MPCAALVSATSYEFAVSAAAIVPASADAPEYLPRHRSRSSLKSRFDIGLPSAWNRRLYMFGNGGYAGEALERRAA